MCDKLVFDLSQEIEGSPNVFVRKDWINILDNQNQNYSNNQSIIDTSQLSNSNKYMSYREAYIAIPMMLTMGTPLGTTYAGFATATGTLPASTTTFNDFASTTAGSINGDYVMGLKSWFGTIIHSMTLDYNGTTICQQTPYSNMWNSFKLMTSLSYQDLISQGDQIGFYPDESTSFSYYPTVSGAGTAIDAAPVINADYLINGGCCNNSNFLANTVVSGYNNSFQSGQGNLGFLTRQQTINFNGSGLVGPSTSTTFATAYAAGLTSATYTSLLQGNALNTLWKNYVMTNKVSGVLTTTAANATTVTTAPILQINIVGMIKLKHLHSFFNMCPLLKGVFMKLTLNLNNASTTIMNTWTRNGAGALTTSSYSGMWLQSVSNSVGGVNPLMIASPATSNGGIGLSTITSTTLGTAGGTLRISTIANVSVGAKCLDSALAGIAGYTAGSLAQSIYLYVPAYTFNPTFEQAYLSTPVKQINYTDIYQYQIQNVASNGVINNLVTNGIANIKSILVLPFYSPLTGAGSTATLKTGNTITYNSNTNLPNGIPVYQSPFDPAGTGPTSPLSHITNFNVQISGQNAIYNLQKYVWEEFNNQLYGQNAVNGGLTDGLTSGLVGRQDFDMEYCYYYVNVERMLPVEQSVPKSVQIIGTNMSSKACDYWVFVEYGVSVPIDVLTGARV
jgi:hypothetical protein